MKTVTFQAKDLKEALTKVREQLGPDALILSTREVAPLLGFGRPLMEVVAQAPEAKDPRQQQAPQARRPAGPGPAQAARPLDRPLDRPLHRVGLGAGGLYTRTGRPQQGPALGLHREPATAAPLRLDDELGDELWFEMNHEEGHEPAARPPHGRAAEHRGEGDEDAIAARLLPLQREVRALKSQLFQVSQSSAQSGSQSLKQEVDELRAVIRTMSQNARTGEITSDVARLMNLGLERSRAEALLKRAAEIGGDPEATLRKAVAERVSAAGPVGVSARVAAFIGPTGVGKTTTIAKIAARASLIDGARVALITIDTFRVGAIDQLQRYADLMELPLHVAGTSTALKAAVVSNAGADLILVDTAGRGPRDVAQLAALRELLGSTEGVEIHLCLAATTRAREQALALQSYRPLHPTRLCITKLDEAVGLGEILSLHETSRLPISYFGTGQKVPEDLELCSPESFADRLLKSAIREPATPAPAEESAAQGGRP